MERKSLRSIGKELYELSTNDTKNQLIGLHLVLLSDNYETIKNNSLACCFKSLAGAAFFNSSFVHARYANAVKSSVLDICCREAGLSNDFGEVYTKKDAKEFSKYLEDIYSSKESEYAKAYLFCQYIYTLPNKDSDVAYIKQFVNPYVYKIDEGCEIDIEYLYRSLFFMPKNKHTLKAIVYKYTNS